MKYNKLVRDKIPEKLKNKGLEYITHIASDEEYNKKLLEKLSEEVNEFLIDKNEEELADILEVIDAIIEYKNFDKENIKKLKQKKKEKNGGFKYKIILDEII